jgi:hypothetical protein
MAFIQVKTAAKYVGVRTRGVNLKEKREGKEPAAAEFFEDSVVVRTGK